ncbi:MAG: SIMPL domain-containing protein [Candidatus Aegiribacteria sp.]|nr:SIMPL domain-containing protein [Candidatus Aegiribacteria sp.]
MKNTGLVIIMVLLMFTGIAVSQQCYDYPALITTTGMGTASAEPDVASIVFGVDITRSEPDVAVDDAARMIHSAMAAARAEGVAGEDMQTVSYNLWVEQIWDDYDYEYTGEMEYHVIHYIKADIRDIESVGDVLAAVVSEGANSITGVSFFVEDTSALYEEARQYAAEYARDKAQQLADCFGIKLGAISSISEWTNNYYNYYEYGAYDNYGGGLGSYAQSPSITPGAYSISVEVSVSFNIEE